MCSAFETFIQQVRAVSLADAEQCVQEVAAFLALGELDDDMVLSVMNNRVAFCAVMPANRRYTLFVAASGNKLVLMGGGTSPRRADQLRDLEKGLRAVAEMLGETSQVVYVTFGSPEEFKTWRKTNNWTKPAA